MKRVPNGVAAPLAQMTTPGGACLAFDESSLYWIDGGRGILRVAK